MKLGVLFAEIYDRLALSFIYKDQAPEQSVLRFSVQLFSVPSISLYICQHCDFLQRLLGLIRFHFIPKSNEALHLTYPQLQQQLHHCNSKEFENRRYFQLFHDLKYLMLGPLVRKWLPTRPDILKNIVGLLNLFQGMDPQKRVSGEHVEYENETWVHAFNLTLQLARLCRYVAQCWHETIPLPKPLEQNWKELSDAERTTSLVTVIQGLIKEMALRTRQALSDGTGRTGWINLMRSGMLTVNMLSYGNDAKVVRWNVAEDPISFHHPLHWLLAELLSGVRYLGKASLSQYYGTTFDLSNPLAWLLMHQDNTNGEVLEPIGRDMLLRILDYPLRGKF